MSGGGGGETSTAEPWEASTPFLLGQVPSRGEAQQWVTDPRTGETQYIAGSGPTTGMTGLLPATHAIFEEQLAADPYSGQLYARPGETTLAAQGTTLDIAGQIPGYAQPVTQYGQDVLGGQYLDPASNPYLQDYMQTAIQPLEQSLMENVLPGIRGEAISAGGYGGSRQGIAEGQAIEGYMQEAGAITSQMAAEAYEAERQRQMMAPDLITQGMQMQLTQPELMGQIGMQQQAEQQALLDEQYALWQMEQQQAWDPVQQYANILLPASGLGGVQTSSGPAPNPVAGAAGGAMMGAQVGGPYGAVIGGVAGGLLSS